MALRSCPSGHAVQTSFSDRPNGRYHCPTCRMPLTMYSRENVERQLSGYWAAPCEVCGLPINVGNYPPVIESLNHFGVRCLHHATER